MTSLTWLFVSWNEIFKAAIHQGEIESKLIIHVGWLWPPGIKGLTNFLLNSLNLLFPPLAFLKIKGLMLKEKYKSTYVFSAHLPFASCDCFCILWSWIGSELRRGGRAGCQLQVQKCQVWIRPKSFPHTASKPAANLWQGENWTKFPVEGSYLCAKPSFLGTKESSRGPELPGGNEAKPGGWGTDPRCKKQAISSGVTLGKLILLLWLHSVGMSLGCLMFFSCSCAASPPASAASARQWSRHARGPEPQCAHRGWRPAS